MRTHIASILVSCAAFAGCGGGGSASTAPPVALEPDVPLTEANALDAAQAAVRAAFDIERIAYVGISFLRVPPPLPPDPPPATPATLPGLLSVTVPGPEGGEAVLSWEDVQGDEVYSTGDRFTIDFENYGAEGLVFDGVAQIDGLSLLGVITLQGTWIAEADLRLLGVSVVIGAQTTTLSVTIPVRLESRQIVELFDAEVPVDMPFGPIDLKAGNRMSRYTGEEERVFVFDGAVYSSVLDGVLLFGTETTLGGFTFFADPVFGHFYVYGANGSLLEMEAGFFTLEIRVDEDGDGQFEAAIPSSFFDLLPS